jgi:hypothetical protein
MLSRGDSLSLMVQSLPHSLPDFQSLIRISQDFKQSLLDCSLDDSPEHLLEFCLAHLGNCTFGHKPFLSNSGD